MNHDMTTAAAFLDDHAARRRLQWASQSGSPGVLHMYVKQDTLRACTLTDAHVVHRQPTAKSLIRTVKPTLGQHDEHGNARLTAPHTASDASSHYQSVVSARAHSTD